MVMGTDLAEILDRAVAKDAELRRLALELESKKLSLKQDKALRGPSLSIGASGSGGIGSTGLSFSHDFSPTAPEVENEIGLTATISGDIGDPLRSQFSVEVPLTYGLGGELDWNLKTSVTQPISPLLGWQPRGAAILEIETSIQKVRIAVM